MPLGEGPVLTGRRWETKSMAQIAMERVPAGARLLEGDSQRPPLRELRGGPERDSRGLPLRDAPGVPEVDLRGMPARDLRGVLDQDSWGLRRVPERVLPCGAVWR